MKSKCKGSTSEWLKFITKYAFSNIRKSPDIKCLQPTYIKLKYMWSLSFYYSICWNLQILRKSRVLFYSKKQKNVSLISRIVVSCRENRCFMKFSRSLRGYYKSENKETFRNTYVHKLLIFRLTVILFSVESTCHMNGCINWYSF